MVVDSNRNIIHDKHTRMVYRIDIDSDTGECYCQVSESDICRDVHPCTDGNAFDDVGSKTETGTNEGKIKLKMVVE